MALANFWTKVSRNTSVAVEATSYDAWLRARVQAALEDARAGTSQFQVMQAAQALIDAKRQGQFKRCAGP
ncbi:StaA [Roseovarius sp.]|uniref:antitoxin PaaA2 family protein n=1 Tax=Roseovarius sp. TaxID=1486281 RepID=UPI003BA8906C